jgi:hypothetical protein
MKDPKPAALVAAIRLACRAPMRLTGGMFTLTLRAVAGTAPGGLPKFTAWLLDYQ